MPLKENITCTALLVHMYNLIVSLLIRAFKTAKNILCGYIWHCVFKNNIKFTQKDNYFYVKCKISRWPLIFAFFLHYF